MSLEVIPVPNFEKKTIQNSQTWIDNCLWLMKKLFQFSLCIFSPCVHSQLWESLKTNSLTFCSDTFSATKDLSPICWCHVHCEMTYNEMSYVFKNWKVKCFQLNLILILPRPHNCPEVISTIHIFFQTLVMCCTILSFILWQQLLITIPPHTLFHFNLRNARYLFTSKEACTAPLQWRWLRVSP